MRTQNRLLNDLVKTDTPRELINISDSFACAVIAIQDNNRNIMG
jgi:hypothetical protein